MTACVRSSLTLPLPTLTSIDRGTAQLPARTALPLLTSMDVYSLAVTGISAAPVSVVAGRSVTNRASSVPVRAFNACSSRSSSSSIVSRPSPAATRSCSAIRSRSAWDTLISGTGALVSFMLSRLCGSVARASSAADRGGTTGQPSRNERPIPHKTA